MSQKRHAARCGVNQRVARVRGSAAHAVAEQDMNFSRRGV
jgi:hypothetical protein